MSYSLDKLHSTKASTLIRLAKSIYPDFDAETAIYKPPTGTRAPHWSCRDSYLLTFYAPAKCWFCGKPIVDSFAFKFEEHTAEFVGGFSRRNPTASREMYPCPFGVNLYRHDSCVANQKRGKRIPMYKPHSGHDRVERLLKRGEVLPGYPTLTRITYLDDVVREGHLPTPHVKWAVPTRK